MTTATLQSFRDLHEAMQGSEPRDWQWIGPHASQRMFGITQARATEYAALYGGMACVMLPTILEMYPFHPEVLI